jgi:formate hydrogenlyase subunit 3/multisubunit Na+/H+ antiporter MnhD subunit
MLTPETAVVIAMVLCLLGAGGVLPWSRCRTAAGWVAFGVTAAAAALVGYAVVRVFTGHGSHPAEYLRMPGLGFALRVYVDGLSAWFLMLAAAISLPAMFFSIRYMDHYPDYSVARYYPNFLVFLAAMYGLVSTTDMMWFFFIFWQMMTLPGYALIRYENRKRESIRAANKYLVMMQIACALTMLGAEILALGSAEAAGASLKYDFDSVSANLPALLQTRSGLAMGAFLLFLVGFGIKLGMWPFGQVWLPDAHPAAPSPVSAMLSGVMIKTGIYGIMRYFLWLVPAGAQADYPLAAWGMVIAVLGTITLFTGTAQALKQEQTKRLLAFHSIGQVGYILLGIGTCLALLPAANATLAALATVAFYGALLHTFNHGLFKSLLFLNSGSMLRATHTQDLNQLGGLWRLMPVTGATALIASLSISGVPLFNGFVSKWTLFLAAFQGGAQAKFLVVCGIIAVLTSALTLASFIKFFGASFLSRTSAPVAKRAQQGLLEAGWMLQLPQVVLALLCLAGGIVPAVFYRLMDHVLQASGQGLGTVLAQAAPVQGGWFGGIAGWQDRAAFGPFAFAVVLGLMVLLVFGLSRLGRSQRRQAAPWLCGYDRETDFHRYAAHGFYGEFKRWLRWLGGDPHPRSDNHAAKKKA